MRGPLISGGAADDDDDGDDDVDDVDDVDDRVMRACCWSSLCFCCSSSICFWALMRACCFTQWLPVSGCAILRYESLLARRCGSEALHASRGAWRCATARRPIIAMHELRLQGSKSEVWSFRGKHCEHLVRRGTHYDDNHDDVGSVYRVL